MSNNIDARAFRRALGNFATGVTVITAQNSKEQKVGVTANSFNSVSLDPPLVLWSLAKDARSFDVFDSANNFAVNILASDQIELSNHFSRQQEDKFASIHWEAGIGGCPLLQGCAGRLQCEPYERVDAGDHWVFLGKVVVFDDLGRAPLCYHQGSYSIISSHPGLVKKEEQAATAAVSGGRLNDSIYLLLRRALHSYQSTYLPKLEALGMSTTEAAAIFLLSDSPTLFSEGIPEFPNVPLAEIVLVLDNLSEDGWVAPVGNGYTLTETGLRKAAELWALAESHTGSVFKDHSDGVMGRFKEILRSVG